MGGVAILLFAAITLVFVVTNTHRHFVNLFVKTPEPIAHSYPL